MEMVQCPISYGFYESEDFTPNTAALLLQAWADRKAGIVPLWGDGSVLYHMSMHYISGQVGERESEQIEAMKPPK